MDEPFEAMLSYFEGGIGFIFYSCTVGGDGREAHKKKPPPS